MIIRPGHARPATTSKGASTPITSSRAPHDFAGALSIRWTVTPISGSPLRIAHNTGAGPR